MSEKQPPREKFAFSHSQNFDPTLESWSNFVMSKVAAILRSHDLAKHQGVRRRHTTPNGPIVQEARKAATDYQLFSDQWEQNFHPDPMGRHNEPKSIYSPVSPARLRFDGPKKR